MMFKEIIQNDKIKVVIVIVLVIFLFTVIYCIIQPKKENNSPISKTKESEEVSAVSGDWKITKYLGESVEYHGAEATKDYLKNKSKWSVSGDNKYKLAFTYKKEK